MTMRRVSRGGASSGRVPEEALRERYGEALALHRQGDLPAAEALYRQILAAMPASFHALHMLGVLRGQRDDPAGAERLIAAAIRIDPRVAAAHANLGNVLRQLKRRPDALASYERALRLQPGNARALKGLGLILWESERREETLSCYDKLLEAEPDYADGWIMKAAALNHLGRRDEAIASYRKALALADVTHPDKIRYVLAAMGSEAVPAASPVEYVRDLFDKYARRFEDHLVNRLNYRAPELLVAQLRPFFGEEPVDVLDLGCGTGLCGPLLAPWARSLTGVDVSQKMLDEARDKQLYDRLELAEITAWLPTQSAASFDLIVSTDVFIYIGDLAPVFTGAHRVLRPGGLFAFSTEVSEGAETHLLASLRYAHSAAYLERIAKETGWSIESVTTQVLREENQQGVSGQIAVLRRQG